MPFEIVRNDITKMDVDVIVNAANSQLQMGGGVCGAIFQAAGAAQLQAACNEIGSCPVGGAVMTEAFQLPAKRIIHTVGPIWRGGSNKEQQQLENCYLNTLQLAIAEGYESIAFPLISSGIYGYPKDQALQVAISTISSFLMKHDLLVYLVVFDRSAFVLSGKLFSSIRAYIDEHTVQTLSHKLRRIPKEVEMLQVSESTLEKKTDLEHFIHKKDESFSRRLLWLIDEKGMTDVDTYKKANIDRRLFSKIKNNIDYTPMKKTAIAFAIALELTIEETEDLLGRAGYTLSKSHTFDLIIRYFIEQEQYDIFEINEALFAFEQDLLGA